MTELDILIKEKLIPMRRRIINNMTQKNPQIFGMINSFLSDKENKVGIKITENGITVEEYTFHLKGLDIDSVETGSLSSEIRLPLGIIKPYGIVEKRVLEDILNDEEKFINSPFDAMEKYLPGITIKFL